MKKSIIIIITILTSILIIPTLTAEQTTDSGPELETHIVTGFGTWLIDIHVKNIGDSTAHNVTVTEIVIDGNVIFNFQESMLWSVNLAPGEWTFMDANSLIIGFGTFTISMTVSCDEGATSTSSVTGLLLGPLFFIP